MTEVHIQTVMAAIKDIRAEEAEACHDIDIEIEVLNAKLIVAQGVRAIIAEPFVSPIAEREAHIKELMLDIGKTVKNECGTVSFRKGSIRTSWDSKALEGYAAGGHDEILQFKKETEIKPSVTIKME